MYVFIFQSREVQTDIAYTETVGKLKNRLDTLMNSLATLSAEKSKMEASFQQDKKQLRNERDEVSLHYMCICIHIYIHINIYSFIFFLLNIKYLV